MAIGLVKKEAWFDEIRPGETRFATTFITLKSLHDHKLDLQAMVTSSEFHRWRPSRSARGKTTKEIILDFKCWNDCSVIVKIVGPLMRLLRIVDSDEKPTLGYVYKGMYRARKTIKEIFRNKKRSYKPYTCIVKDRWDNQLRKSIHAAAYWLNPAFQYDLSNFSQKPEVIGGLLDVINSSLVGLVVLNLWRRLGSFVIVRKDLKGN